VLVRPVDLRPLYGRSRALFLANAPHPSRHRPGLRAARPLPRVRGCRGSDADALAVATATDKSDAASNRFAIVGGARTGVAFGKSIGKSIGQCVEHRVGQSFGQSFGQSRGVAVRVSDAERLAHFTKPVVLAVARAVGLPIARSQSVAGRAPSRPRA
jgi:hypothetical protein